MVNGAYGNNRINQTVAREGIRLLWLDPDRHHWCDLDAYLV